MSAKFTVSEFNGRAYVSIESAGGKINFGREKARAILANVEAIKKFLEAEDAKAAAKVEAAKVAPKAPATKVRKAPAKMDPAHGGAPVDMAGLMAEFQRMQAAMAALSQAVK